MKRILLSCSLMALSAQGWAAQPAASPENGHALFNKWCLPCHGASKGPLPLPGTGALQVKYKGQIPALLEERTNLPPEFVRTVVRSGLFGMPMTRKTEVSDAGLADIVAYLNRNEKR